MSEDRPGYKLKGNKREYWSARGDLVRRGYRPKNVRLHYDQSNEGRAQLAAKCRALHAEMLAWAANDGQFPARGYDGTIGSLCRLYETHEHSPFQRRLKWNSRENVTKSIKIIVGTVGARQVGRLLGPDFLRWHDQWGAPAAPGAKARPWRARHAIDAVRFVVSFGVTLGFEDCFRADVILGKIRFEKPAPRTAAMTLLQALAVRDQAHAMGLGSVALATVLQFELAFRQKDVVGEWEPTEGIGDGGIIYGRRRWVNGLTWGDISPAMILTKITTKKRVAVEHDLTLSPMVLEEIARVPREVRFGPMIVSEATGRPYGNRKFSDAFRRVATAAGLPRTLWSMDARAGAISEFYDAGASQTDVMKTAAHQDPRMSARYDRTTLEKTRRASVQRHAKREANGRGGRDGD